MNTRFHHEIVKLPEYNAYPQELKDLLYLRTFQTKHQSL